MTLRAALALLTPSAQAQRTDISTTPGVFTAPNPNNFIAAGVWDYAPGIGWAVNGRSRETATLLSAHYSATVGTAGISLDHTVIFELRLFGGCFDGGLLASINGGAFSPITAMTGGTGSRGAITTGGGSARAGQNAFCGFANNTQGSMVTSSFLTTLAAGTQVQFAFEGPDRREDRATGRLQGGPVIEPSEPRCGVAAGPGGCHTALPDSQSVVSFFVVAFDLLSRTAMSFPMV